MATDIEFNVRNGMTVGPNRISVMNTSGELSAANLKITTGGSILSAGATGYTDLTTIIDNRADERATTNGYLTSVSEDAVTAHQSALSITESQISDLGTYLTSETTTSLSLANDTLTYTDETGTANTISLAAYTGEGISAIADATDTGIDTPLAGDVLVYVNGTTQQWQNKKNRASLEDMYNYANANFYSEMGYTDDKLTSIDVWVTSSKSTALFERELTYNATGQLTSVVTRDVQGTGGSTRATLTKTLTYTETGALATVTRSYS